MRELRGKVGIEGLTQKRAGGPVAVEERYVEVVI
jgi:hypothetical protein